MNIHIIESILSKIKKYLWPSSGQKYFCPPAAKIFSIQNFQGLTCLDPLIIIKQNCKIFTEQKSWVKKVTFFF